MEINKLIFQRAESASHALQNHFKQVAVKSAATYSNKYVAVTAITVKLQLEFTVFSSMYLFIFTVICCLNLLNWYVWITEWHTSTMWFHYILKLAWVLYLLNTYWSQNWLSANKSGINCPHWPLKELLMSHTLTIHLYRICFCTLKALYLQHIHIVMPLHCWRKPKDMYSHLGPYF